MAFALEWLLLVVVELLMLEEQKVELDYQLNF